MSTLIVAAFAASASTHSLPLLTVEEATSQVSLGRRALARLASSREALNLVTIFGPSRSGKSTLLNTLIEAEVFKTDGGDAPCTQGAELSPFFPEWALNEKSSATLPVAFVDLEGQGDKGDVYDIRLIAPLLTTSKVLIFNVQGRPNKADILGRLGVLNDAASRLGKTISHGRSLYIVLQNVNLHSDARDMLLGEEKSTSQDAEARNAVRRSLFSTFEDIVVVRLPTPVADNTKLETGEFTHRDFKQDFIDATDGLRSKLKLTLSSPSLLGGTVLSGQRVGDIMKHVVELSNNGVTDDVLTKSLRQIGDNAKQGALLKFGEDIRNMEGNMPMPTEAFRALAISAQSRVMDALSWALDTTSLKLIHDQVVQEIEAAIQVGENVNAGRQNAAIKQLSDSAVSCYNNRLSDAQGSFLNRKPPFDKHDASTFQKTVHQECVSSLAAKLSDSALELARSKVSARVDLLWNKFQEENDERINQTTSQLLKATRVCCTTSSVCTGVCKAKFQDNDLPPKALADALVVFDEIVRGLQIKELQHWWVTVGFALVGWTLLAYLGGYMLLQVGVGPEFFIEQVPNASTLKLFFLIPTNLIVCAVIAAGLAAGFCLMVMASGKEGVGVAAVVLDMYLVTCGGRATVVITWCVATVATRCVRLCSPSRCGKMRAFRVVPPHSTRPRTIMEQPINHHHRVHDALPHSLCARTLSRLK